MPSPPTISNARAIARNVAVSAALVIAAAAAIWWWHARAETAPWRPALDAREVATRVLGEHLARRYPGVKALVIGNPFTQRPGQAAEIYAFDRAELRGLEKGLGSKSACKEVFPALRPEFFERPDRVFVDPKTTTPLSFLVREDAFQRLVEAHPGFGLIISFIGCPLNLRQSNFWTQQSKTRFVFLLPDWRLLGDRAAVGDAIKSEKIVAAVIARPGASLEGDERNEGYRAAFDRQFFLVTPENVDELLRTFPQLF